jgi:hypothetical protein
MADIERIKIIDLDVPFEDKKQNIRYENCPCERRRCLRLSSFMRNRRKKSSLAAMRLLIALTAGGIPESVLQQMDFIDYRKCEVYLLGFLTWTASRSGSNAPQM